MTLGGVQVTILTGVWGYIGMCLSRERDWILEYN